MIFVISFLTERRILEDIVKRLFFAFFLRSAPFLTLNKGCGEVAGDVVKVVPGGIERGLSEGDEAEKEHV